MPTTYSEDYSKTYTSFSGADIVVTFSGIIIGSLQAVSYSVSREKAPVYTFGSPEPRSFARGKRGIAGTLVFTVFDRDALLTAFKSVYDMKIQKFVKNDNFENPVYMSIDDWDAAMTSAIAGTEGPIANATTIDTAKYVTSADPYYADELLPFDITITMANEYGQRARMVIYGVELLNEGSGYSIDAVTTEKAYTFVARRIERLSSVDANGEEGNNTGYFNTYGDVLSKQGEEANN